jgi:hypothetical protein
MTSQPEKLFREKLEHFQRPAPAAAWERIEAGLEQPHRKGLWLKIAAGLLLLSVAAFLLWPTTENNTDIVTNTPDPVVPEDHNTLPEEAATPPLPVVEEKIAEQKIRPKQVRSAPAVSSEPVLAIAEEKEILPVTETRIPETIVVESTPESITSTTIVYTADEVNARFMKKTVPAEATPEEKKTSGIQKLMGLAYDLKNNDTAFGDLRQKKNEILALNFKEEKQGQNQ